MKQQANKKVNRVRTWVYVAFVVLLVLIVGFFYCLISGRLLLGNEYEHYKEYKKTYGKYFYIQDLLEKEAIGYTEDMDVIPSGDAEEACDNLLSSLDDPYAEYYSKTQFESFERNFAESYDGIGVMIGDVKFKNQDDIKVLVYSVFEDSPAEKAGMLPGDIIVDVDGTKPQNSDETCKYILGTPGTDVTVTIDRQGVKKVFEMTREKIVEKSVKYEKLDEKNKIGYIAITTFKEGTSEDFKLAVKDLQNDGFNKIVIDLRNNGGGITNEAYDIADYLLPNGIIVSEKDKAGHENTHESDASAASIDFVMLVNKQTASASEIVACAIQDNQGGKIIGEKTYGKGVTQKTQKLYDGSAIKYTVEEYFRPNGKRVNKVGVKPDIKVKNADDDETIFEVAKHTLLNK